MKQDDHARVMLRLPVALKTWLTGRAAENDRSLTGELVSIIKQTKRAEAAAPKREPTASTKAA